jgi:anti-sigma factor RsiW
MRCSTVTKQVTPYLDGRLNPAQREQLEAHLASCAACRQVHAEISSASARLANRGPGEPRPDLPERILRRAFAAGQEPSRVAPEGLLRWLRLPALTTAAASLCTAIVLTFSVPVVHSAADDDITLSSMGELEFSSQAFTGDVLAEEEE